MSAPARTVLTTGANSGIGLATAIELARRGFCSVGSVRSEEKAGLVRRAAGEAGLDVETVLLDVNDPVACEHVIGRMRLYALVNNAGYGQIGAVEDVGDDEARRIVETMLLAPMRLARLALPGMREGGGGRIINVSSIFGRSTIPLAGWYQAAKHGLEAVSDALRMEVAGSGIAVILVEPGGVRTGIWDDVDADRARREGSAYSGSYDRSAALSRLGRAFMVSPERVARVVASALVARVPRTRYLVGLDAQALVLADRITLTPIRDRVARLLFGL